MMGKRISIRFLQAVTVLTGMVTIVLLIWFPLTEGRATGLDLFHIYVDPLILYGYATSVAFFVALYKSFRLLGYIGQDKAFTLPAIRAVRSIASCAILFSILIVIAGLVIRFTHGASDDPAGFLAICMMTACIAIVAAALAAVFESILQRGLELNAAGQNQ